MSTEGTRAGVGRCCQVAVAMELQVGEPAYSNLALGPRPTNCQLAAGSCQLAIEAALKGRRVGGKVVDSIEPGGSGVHWLLEGQMCFISLALGSQLPGYFHKRCVDMDIVGEGVHACLPLPLSKPSVCSRVHVVRTQLHENRNRWGLRQVCESVRGLSMYE